MEHKYIVAIEIGSSHIRAAAGVVDENGDLTILAVEDEYTVDAVRYGWIQNVEEVSSRINKLIRKLENYQSISPRKIKSVYVSIGGRSMMATSRQITRHFEDEIEITSRIIDQIKGEAQNSGLSEREVIEVMPREFMIDNMESINPIGSFGKNIRADINLITCKPVIHKNINRTITDRQAINIKGIYVRQTAIADLVLTADEKKLGCMLVDFGAETTSVSIYKNGSLQYFVTLPIGSRNITRDIMSLNYTEERAEELKRIIGDAKNIEPNIRKNEFDGDPVEVNNYVRARAGEIVANILEQAKYAGYTNLQDLSCGIIVVGGGAKLKGFTDLLLQQSNVSQQNNIRVRLGGIPSNIRISDTRLSSIDMLDVISLLYKASKNNPQECTETIVPVTDTTDIVNDIDDGPGPQPIKKQTKVKGPSLWNKLREKAIGTARGIFDEPDDEDDNQ